MPFSIRILLFAFSLFVFVGAHVYLYRRLIRDVLTHRKWRFSLVGGFGGLSALALFTRPMVRQGVDGYFYAPVLLLFIWTGVVMYLLMFTLILDSVRKMHSFWARRRSPDQEVSGERRLFLAQSLALTSTVATSGMAGFGVWKAFRPPEVTEVPIVLPGLPKALEGLTLVQLTDIHIGPLIQKRFMESLVSQVNGLKPDVVAVTGDLVDGPVSALGSYAGVLGKLQTRYGSYFVTGNHEYYAGVSQWVTALEKMGLSVLRNQHVQIGDAASFDLIGVDDFGTFDRTDYDLEKAVHGRNADRASILLSHQPRNLEGVAEKGIGLMLSGHTHGGQLFPGNWVGSLMWGSRNAGLSKWNNTFLYTSRGCGFVGPPMRVGAPPEIVKVVLLAG